MQNDKTIEDFFKGGFYDEFWGWRFNEKEDRKAAENILKLLNADNGHILDWCGGWGRISRYFAEKGFKVSILDFNEHYLERASEVFREGGFKVDLIHSDCRVTPDNINSDHAVCLFNSVGFFTDDQQVNAFSSLYNTLKVGSRFVIDCMNLEFIKERLQSFMEEEKDGMRYIRTNDLDQNSNIMNSSFKIFDDEGNMMKEMDFRQRLYSPDELSSLLEKAGFTIKEKYGNFGRTPLSQKSAKMVLVAQK